MKKDKNIYNAQRITTALSYILEGRSDKLLSHYLVSMGMNPSEPPEPIERQGDRIEADLLKLTEFRVELPARDSSMGVFLRYGRPGDVLPLTERFVDVFCSGVVPNTEAHRDFFDYVLGVDTYAPVTPRTRKLKVLGGLTEAKKQWLIMSAEGQKRLFYAATRLILHNNGWFVLDVRRAKGVLEPLPCYIKKMDHGFDYSKMPVHPKLKKPNRMTIASAVNLARPHDSALPVVMLSNDPYDYHGRNGWLVCDRLFFDSYHPEYVWVIDVVTGECLPRLLKPSSDEADLERYILEVKELIASYFDKAPSSST